MVMMKQNSAVIFTLIYFLMSNVPTDAGKLKLKKLKVPIVAAPVLVAVPAAAYAASRYSGSVNIRENLGYNVTVSLADDKHTDQEGKLYITLFVPGFKQELKLTPEPVDLKSGKSYSYLINAGYRVDRIDSITLEWKKKPGTNIFGSSKIHVNHVILDPLYINNSTERAGAVKKFCSNQIPLELRTEVKARFMVKC